MPYIYKWLLIILIFGNISVWLGIFGSSRGKIKFVFCDVGQGDAGLVQLGIFQALIDGGQGDRVVDCLSEQMPFWDRKIELMVLTHPQTDHMNGLIEVLRRYRVERVFVNGETSLTADFSAFQKALNEEKTQVFIGNRGDLVRYGELVVKIIWPLEELGKLDDYVSVNTSDSNININEKDVNEGSIVVLVTYNQFDVLFTGDIGIDTERLIISDGIIGEVEVLKVAHHGSKYSSSEGFLTLVSPEIAVISAGKKNRFGHPTKETLERLDQAGARALRTDVLGDVVVETDGEKFRIKN